MARGGRHYANYIMNPSDVKEKEKIPVDSLGSSEVGCLFFAATDGISARTKREFREDASPSSLLPFVSRLLLAFTCLRAVRIQAAFLSPSSLLSGYINYGRCLSVPTAFAFFSSPRSTAFLHLGRATSQRFELVIDSSLDWTLSSRRRSVHINQLSSSFLIM